MAHPDSLAASGASPVPSGSREPTASLAPRVQARNPTVALLALLTGTIAIGITELGTMGILPLIASATQVSMSEAGALISAYAVGVVVGAPLLAVVGARIPRRALLLGLLVMFIVMHLGFALVDSYTETWLLRFFSGFPHGAYLGVASLVAADLVPLPRRTTAVAFVFLGFPLANLLLSPLAVFLSQQTEWQSLYLFSAAAAVLAIIGILVAVPPIPLEPATTSNPLAELSILRNPKVLLTMATACIGFGGSFATMSYITPTFTELAGLSETGVPFIMSAYGVGAIIGTLVAARLARFGLASAIVVAHVGLLIVLSLFGFMAQTVPTAFLGVILVPTFAAALVPLLQTRLMEVAHGGQTLAATLNHATLNIANAFGAWAGGAVLALGLGYAWPSRAGAVLAAVGMVIGWFALRYERRHPEE